MSEVGLQPRGYPHVLKEEIDAERGTVFSKLVRSLEKLGPSLLSPG